MEDWYLKIEIDDEVRSKLCRIGIAVIAAGSTYYISKSFYNNYKYNKRIKKKVDEVNQRKLRLLQKLQGMNNPINDIGKYCKQMSGKEVREKVRKGEINAVDVLEAYQANALIQDSDLNFIADVIYDADVTALMISEKKEQYKEGQDNGELPLLGWPVSVKDCLGIEKYDCTFGCPSHISLVMTQDCVVVKALRNAGANVFMISTCAQGLAMIETASTVFGVTNNPHNTKFTCGGSSGGEGAAIASYSSLGGVGSDIGGSIRIPSHFCGIAGFKPTADRISKKDTKDITDRCSVLIRDSIGTMARRVEEAAQLFRALVSPEVFQMDPSIVPMQFDTAQYDNDSPMRIGWYCDLDNEIGCVPAVQRAVSLAKEGLEGAGHTLVPFKLPKMNEYLMLFIPHLKAYLADGSKTYQSFYKNDKIPKALGGNVCYSHMPMKRTVASVLGICQPVLAECLRLMSGMTVYEEWRLAQEIRDYISLVISTIQSDQLNGIICPVLPVVAVPHNATQNIVEALSYVCIYNLLNFPAGSVPVTHVNQSDLTKLTNNYSKSGILAKKVIKYQADSFNMPVGVQCVALPWRDETCLRLMREVEKVVKFEPIKKGDH